MVEGSGVSLAADTAFSLIKIAVGGVLAPRVGRRPQPHRGFWSGWGCQADAAMASLEELLKLLAEIALEHQGQVPGFGAQHVGDFWFLLPFVLLATTVVRFLNPFVE